VEDETMIAPTNAQPESHPMPEAPRPDYYGLDYSGGQWGEPVLKEAERRVKDYSAQAEELQGEGYDPETDDYAALRRAGFTHNERAGAAAVQAKIGDLYDATLRGTGETPVEMWGFVGEQEARNLQAGTGLEITAGYAHLIDASAIRHTLSHHGDPVQEAQRGQIAVTREDFQKIPEIIRAHDGKPEYVGKDERGLDLVRYEKSFDGETIYVVEEVRIKRNQLALKTIYKRQAPALNEAPPPALTSETVRGMTPWGNAEALLKNRDLSEVNPTMPISEVKPKNSGTIGEGFQEASADGSRASVWAASY
jgi:hypothetical protein